MRVICQRRWGQPKLVKPKECNNKNLLGSVNFAFFGKGTKCKVWQYENTIYILHRDWFSDCISFDEAAERGIIEPRHGKFIYKDNFGGGVILRNEAVFCFEMPDMTKFILDSRLDLIKQFSTMLGVKWFDLYAIHRWEDFFMEVLTLIKEKTQQKESSEV